MKIVLGCDDRGRVEAEVDRASQEEERRKDRKVADKALEFEWIENSILADVEEEQPVCSQVD